MCRTLLPNRNLENMRTEARKLLHDLQQRDALADGLSVLRVKRRGDLRFPSTSAHKAGR